MDSRNELTHWQQQMLSSARNLELGKAPEPWVNRQSVSAAGVFAGGWMANNNFIILSSDGYSIFHPISGDQIIFDTNTDAMYSGLDEHELNFKIPSTSEVVRIFGIRSGDGIHYNSGWGLSVIYPWWPNATIVLYRKTLLDWKTVYGLDPDICDPGNWIKCGFSPSGNSFVLLGHAGAVFYSKET